MAFDFFYGLVPQEGQGSGFIIDKEGHILTNYHVIADARQLEVTLHNRKKFRAVVIGTDRSHDLAVIQISAPNLPAVPMGDSDRLRQILLNLLSNAIKFTEAGSVRLEIGREPGDGLLHFAVIDTGVGIPVGKQRLIFEPFRRGRALSSSSCC